MFPIPKRLIVAALACLVASIGGYFGRPVVDQQIGGGSVPIVTPAADPQPVKPAAVAPGEMAGHVGGVLRGNRIEITDAAGRVAMILAADASGSPFLIVYVNGQPKRLDLAALARRLG